MRNNEDYYSVKSFYTTMGYSPVKNRHFYRIWNYYISSFVDKYKEGLRYHKDREKL